MSGPHRNLGPGTATWALVGSVVAHLAIVGSVGFIAYRSLAQKDARDAARNASEELSPSLIAVELPGVAEGTLVADREVVPEGIAPSTFGGAAVARLDTGSPGTGGEAASLRATNLAAMDDHMRLDTDLQSRRDRDQIQRLKTATQRTTHEDRRSTTHPMELTFLATGTGQRAERRPDAPSDPSRGSLVSNAAAVVGGEQGSGAVVDEGAGARGGATRAGQLFGSPGVGVRDAEPGADHRKGARIAHARPAVTEGAPSIPGIWNGRPNDTVDSEQEVTDAVRSLVQASTAGGRSGEGRGGTVGPADPGAGGGAVGRASIARPLGSGEGDLIDWNTDDPMLLPYFRRIHAKVDPLWANAFPKSAMLELKQGTVIIEFSIAPDGSAKVSWPPVRPSGIDEFDRNCADAIRRASPFEPLPPALKEAGRTMLRIRAPFIAKNPIIR